ncbi:MFS transporter [Candidatus Woesearchaeota archaeon]|nr:MFS transporter [Candidatus Woesearchaeota archaeon]
MRQPKRIKKSLFYSIVDGSFWSVMFGMGEKYLSAFAVFLKATNVQIGLLTSLPLLFSSLSQFLSLKLIDVFKTRKKFIVTSSIIQALTWLPILLVFFFGKFRVYFLILFAVVYWVSGMIAVPAWNSWMGDLVDAKIRGSYFSKRNRITGLVIFVSFVSGGIILDLFKNGADRQYIGFAIIFLVALVSRLMSAFFLSKKYEPYVEIRAEHKFSFTAFLKQARFRNYGLFVIFLTMMNFSVYLAAPFFVAYMLYDLQLSYLMYMMLISTAFITKYLSLPVWGELLDTYGTKKLLQLTGFLIAFSPLFWLFSTKYYFLILIQMYGGIMWAGFELASFNFVFDTTTTEKRARCVSYYNVINGIMIFLGATIGSLIIKYNNVFWTKYYLVFLISGILRLGTAAFFLPKLKEVRKVKEISYNRIFLKAMDMILSQSFRSVNLLAYPRKFRRVMNVVRKKK